MSRDPKNTTRRCFELTFELPTQQAAKLTRAAAKRDVTRDSLLISILETVLRDDLVDAVLDDDASRESAVKDRAA